MSILIFCVVQKNEARPESLRTRYEWNNCNLLCGPIYKVCYSMNLKVFQVVKRDVDCKFGQDDCHKICRNGQVMRTKLIGSVVNGIHKKMKELKKY